MSNETMSNETMNNETMNNETMNNETINNETMNNETMNNGPLGNGAMDNLTGDLRRGWVEPGSLSIWLIICQWVGVAKNRDWRLETGDWETERLRDWEIGRLLLLRNF